ncbi:Fe-S cluster assembly protein HesB [Microbacterium aurantiacum]|uniref:Fe-S cluster assembly protein HesB n=1 Tax=Microbacterium aurantiacum TaxID=162393 RepID=A0AAJ2HJD2_9MICO|nr:Fe-S cluster assembly protein HesB [Microbacterium aurantiacum]MDS0245849.1 Fe-S cluster assembly protein HesB [Microbacterium aurantiacum]
MLTMTDTAAEAVKTIVSRVPEAGDGGVRIRDTGAQNGFELSVAPAPEPQDTVVVTDGARVFLDEAANTALDDRVLDAELGQDGSVRFALGSQA